ncbi:MAG: pyruvate formate-lyase [Clostridia bacterium]|nr:pyruvate formate-lyase [Clostridia bacterium]
MSIYKLTERCSALKEQVVDSKEHSKKYIGQRIYNYLKGYYSLSDEQRSNETLAAASLASVIENAEAFIEDGELIVGYNYSDGKYSSGIEESFIFWNLKGNAEGLREYLKQGVLNEEQIEWVISCYNKDDSFSYPHEWQKNPIPDEPLRKADGELLDELASFGFCLTHNHTILDYEKVLKKGFKGILDEIVEARKNAGILSKEQGNFYNASEILCKACCEIGHNYARKAKEKINENKSNEKRIEELTEIEKICSNVPENPTHSFREALQSIWFAHIINTWEDGINANSLGRLDQILYPYYIKDIESGILTKEDAFELICCLWLKLYRDYDVQQSTVGGCDTDGKTAENELSYMMLDATEALNFVRCLSVRFSHDTPKRFIHRALEVVGHVQKGIPFFFNDDVMIPALEARGIKSEDARNYSAIGCVETCIPGKANPHAVTARCNLLKAIEYALSNGQSMLNPTLFPGVSTGYPQNFDSFEKLKEAVFIQIKNMIDVSCKVTNNAVRNIIGNAPVPFKSMLTEGCISSGKDFNDGGPLYNYYQIMLFGIPNLADSMAAIKKLVYDEKKYSMEELLYHLKNNFPDERVRLEFVNKAPKYGNDISEVDNLAADIMNFACDYIATKPSVFGQGFHPQPFTFLWMVDHGRTTAATPDGRRNGEILAYSMSPMQGRDFSGFTALLNSISSLPSKKAPGTTSSIVEVSPYLFNYNNLDYFTDALLTAGQKGLANVQFNTCDADTLIAAQKEPDKYKNLAVRVSGFSQKFCLLDKTMQDHIINRTKHTAF